MSTFTHERTTAGTKNRTLGGWDVLGDWDVFVG
jgi:hypothetical protein